MENFPISRRACRVVIQAKAADLLGEQIRDSAETTKIIRSIPPLNEWT